LVLAAKVVTFRRPAIPVHGLRIIGFDTPPTPIEIADGPCRGRVSVLRRLQIPAQRLAIVSRNAEAKVIQLPHLKFGRRISFSRSPAKPADRFRGALAAIVKERAKRELRDDIAACGARASGSNRALNVGIILRPERCRWL
jgi:hypothetical protein